MGRRKRYISGKVYICNDNLLVKHYKPGRRVVVINNNKKAAHIKRITKLANNGRNAKKGIRIEKYPDIKKDSVVENKTFRKTRKGKNIDISYMKETKTRLNKWDMSKLKKHRN